MPEMPQITQVQFGTANYAVLFLYLLLMLAIGWWVGRRVQGTRAFFVAEGRMGSVVVGLSLLGTYLSSLTMMALPGVSFGKDDMLWSIQLPFLILTAFVITRWVLPRYREAGVVSVYEYLEQRVHVSARLLASTAFLALQVGRMGLVLYLPALALAITTGADLVWTIIIMGIVVTAYAVWGGIEAVIWTDAAQVIILTAGALASLFYILPAFAATGQSFGALAVEHHKLRMVEWSLDIKRVTTVWLVLQTVLETIRIYGTQQDMTQRYMATGSTAKANRSVWISILGYIPLGYLFYFIGAALFLYYQATAGPTMGPDIQELIAHKREDAIYPYFIVRVLPAGMAGLVIAAIWAAAQSTLASSMNSCSTVCIEDFYKRFWGRGREDQHYLRVARWLTVVWGAAQITMALLFIHIQSAQVQWTKIMGATANGVLALMALAFLPFRVRWWAAVGGFVLCYASFLVLWFTKSTIHPLLWTVIGNLICFSGALLLNWIGSRAEGRGQPTPQAPEEAEA